MSNIIPYIKLMRPFQWIKNLFCFAGLVFGFHFAETSLVINSIICFMAFCMAASAVYVLNDIFDVASDKLHPKKKFRPIASGIVSVTKAWIFYIILIIIALGLSLKVNVLTLYFVLFYILLNVYYSLSGKHVVILDVFIISCGFILRICSGTYGVGIASSEWLFLCVICLTLFLGFSKRRAELLQCEKMHLNGGLRRRVLEHYEPKMLDIFVAITAASAIISYALFIVVGKSVPNLIFTVIFVIYGVFRYIYLLYNHEAGQNTANDLLDDKHLILTVILGATFK